MGETNHNLVGDLHPQNGASSGEISAGFSLWELCVKKGNRDNGAQ
jgi:hypothetical protein